MITKTWATLRCFSDRPEAFGPRRTFKLSRRTAGGTHDPVRTRTRERSRYRYAAVRWRSPVYLKDAVGSAV
jgi:hypothetical protein